MFVHKLIDFVVDINGSVIDHCKMYNQLLNVSDCSQRIAVSEVVFSEYCSQFGGFHRELRLVRWFSQSIAVNSVLFADSDCK
jgi:hypothetical protein